MELAEFVKELEDDVLDEAKNPRDGSDGGDAEDFKENAFTRIVLDDLASAGALEAGIECHFRTTYKGQEIKVNGYDIPEEDSRLDLIVTDYRHTTSAEPARLNSDDVDRSFKLAERFLKYVTTPGTGGPDPSQAAYSMIRNISSRASDFKRVQIWLVTNGVVATKRERQKPQAIPGYVLSREIWDLERMRRFRSGGASHEPIEVDLSAYPGGGLACLSNSDPDLGYSTSVAVVPGAVLADWYEEYGSRLLELNVRSYLQAKGKINKEILETLIKTPNRFLAYNNGITIVAEDIEFTEDQTRIKKMRGLQIVNGGQTTASIHRAKREYRADLSHVYVQAKITKVQPDQFEQMVPEISRLSNTQNKVNEVDLRANHRFHIGLERVAIRRWIPGEHSKWFYERARGSYQTERSRQGRTRAQRDRFDREFPPNQRIVKEDIARYVNAYEGYPHFVSRGGQKNFKRFMDSIPSLPSDWEPPEDDFKEFIGKTILFRRAQAIAKEVGIPAFRINVVAYTVAVLSLKAEQAIDFVHVWDKQAISKPLEAQIAAWLPKVNDCLMLDAGGRNPTEWFKLEQCWVKLRERTDSWQLSKEALAELGTSRRAATGAATTAIAACKRLAPQEWLQIYHWGEESEKLPRQQLEIARRMSELAFGEWRRDPTPRQAVEATKVAQAYERRFAQGT